MPLDQDEIISVCQQLAEQEHLQVCVTESFKGALITGATTLAGGLLMGPPGLVIGAVMGSLGAAARSKGKFKSVVEIIMDMTPAQKAKLAESVKKSVGNISAEEVTMFTMMIMSNASLKQAIITEVAKFLKNEMNLPIA